jgi:hypothetical protein
MNFAVGIPMVRMVLAANVATDKHSHDHGKSGGDTKTPIKHVIVIIGENRTFEIEDPNPQANTNNWYTEDGYGGGGFGKPVFGGGSYTDCADTSQAGVGAVDGY